MSRLLLTLMLGMQLNLAKGQPNYGTGFLGIVGFRRRFTGAQ
jgi:hypothetical protein